MDYEPRQSQVGNIVKIGLAVLFLVFVVLLLNIRRDPDSWISQLLARINSAAFYVPLLMILIGLIPGIRSLRQHDRHATQADRLRANGKLAEAEQVLRSAIAKSGNTIHRLHILGTILMEQNRFEESLELFKQSETLSKSPVWPLNNQATVLHRMNRKAEALEVIKRAYALDSNNFLILTNYCLMLAENGDRDQALDLMKQIETLCNKLSPNLHPQWIAIRDQCRDKVGISKGFEVIFPETKAQ